MNILNLSDLNVTQAQEQDSDYLIKVDAVPPCSCPNCYTENQLIKFGSKDVLYMDLPMHGKRVGILLNQQRYKCNSCNKTFRHTPSCFDDKRYMTKRLKEYIEKSSISSNKTFVSLAEETGLLEKTVRDIFKDYVQQLGKEHAFDTPNFLGIDEIHLIKRPRGILTNIKEQTILDILSNRNKNTIEQWLRQLPNRKRIECVSMDMWNPYKDAVKRYLPQAQIVVDKFHLVRMANTSMDTIRKDLRAELTAKQRKGLMRDRYVLLKRNKDLMVQDRMLLKLWTENYPILKKAYNLKEEFYNIWDTADSPNTANTLLSDWKAKITDDVYYAFEPILTALNNWENEIFSYFEYHVTNAYTESLNNLIRVANRIGRGYSFEVIRAKMLYSEGIRKQPKKKYDINNFVAEGTFYDSRIYPPIFNIYDETNKDYGADITTIIQKITKGAL